MHIFSFTHSVSPGEKTSTDLGLHWFLWLISCYFPYLPKKRHIFCMQPQNLMSWYIKNSWKEGGGQELVTFHLLFLVRANLPLMIFKDENLEGFEHNYTLTTVTYNLTYTTPQKTSNWNIVLHNFFHVLTVGYVEYIFRMHLLTIR